MSKILILLTGAPASGKSTFSDRLTELIFSHNMHVDERSEDTVVLTPKSTSYYDGSVVSSDEQLEWFAQGHGITYTEAFERWIKIADELFWANLKGEVAANTTIVCVDRTHMTEKSRLRTIEAVHSVPYSGEWKIAVVDFRPSQKVLDKFSKDRQELDGKYIPMNIVQRMLSSYENPQNDAYVYDDVFRVSDDGTEKGYVNSFEKTVAAVYDYVSTYATKKQITLDDPEEDDDE